jgi:hypothetical protein
MDMEYLRSFRIGGISMIDLVGSIVILYGIFRFLGLKNPSLWTLIWVLPISIIGHLLVNQPTTLNFYMGLSSRPSSSSTLSISP